MVIALCGPIQTTENFRLTSEVFVTPTAAGVHRFESATRTGALNGAHLTKVTLIRATLSLWRATRVGELTWSEIEAFAAKTPMLLVRT